MTKLIKINVLKTNKFYTTEMLKILLGVHKRTIQTWVHKGLKLASSDRPRLFRGKDVKDFIKEKQRKRKFHLEKNQFLCMRCKKAVKSLNNSVLVVETGKVSGRDNIPEIHIIGTCENCSTFVYRISNLKKIPEIISVFKIENIEEIQKIQEKNMLQEKGLNKSNNYLCNNDLTEEKNEKI